VSLQYLVKYQCFKATVENKTFSVTTQFKKLTTGNVFTVSLIITHSHVNGKGQNSTLRHTETPSLIFTKIGRRAYDLAGTRHTKFCSDRFRGFCSPNTCTWFCRAFGVTNFLFVFGGSSIRLRLTPFNGFLRKIRQKTSFRVSKSLLGSRWLYLIFCPLYFEKPPFGDQFWLDSFFATEKSLALDATI